MGQYLLFKSSDSGWGSWGRWSSWKGVCYGPLSCVSLTCWTRHINWSHQMRISSDIKGVAELAGAKCLIKYVCFRNRILGFQERKEFGECERWLGCHGGQSSFHFESLIVSTASTCEWMEGNCRNNSLFISLHKSGPGWLMGGVSKKMRIIGKKSRDLPERDWCEICMSTVENFHWQ